MKKFVLAFVCTLCFITAFAAMPVWADTVAEGTLGDSIEWKFDIQGTFTITGEGAVQGYGNIADVPWYNYLKDIKSVVVGEGITELGRCTFWGCTELTQVTFPSTLQNADVAFTGCYNLHRANITDMTMWAQLGFVWDGSDPVEEAPLSKQIYLDGDLVTEAVIPEGTEYIAPWAFRYCPDITSVTIGEGVKSVGMFAFAECYNLHSVSLPSTLTYIDSAAFSECPVDTVELADIGAWFKTEFGNTTAHPLLTSEKGKTLKLKGREITELVIPQGVTEISADAFAWCTKIRSVVIPEGVTETGDRAFYICSSIEDITVPSTLAKVGEDAFYGCDSVKNVYINDLKAWLDTDMTAKNANPMSGVGEKTIWLKGEKITKLVIPEGTTHIRADAFSHCSNITQLVLPSTVSEIGDRAFGWCYGMEKVVFLGDPPAMGEDVFYAGAKYFYYPAGNEAWENFDRTYFGHGTECVEYMPLTIESQPANISASSGETVCFKVTAVGAGLSYQWQFSNDGVKWTNNTVKGSGCNTDTLSVDATQAKSGRRFRCVVADICNNKVVSDSAVLNVQAPLKITAQPKNITVKAGSTAKFTVGASGDGLKYQWQFSNDGKKWTNNTVANSGYRTKTLSAAATAAKNGRMFRCVVIDKYGNKVITAIAVLNVQTPLKITAQPKNITIKAGSTAKFTVGASGDGLKYQWQFSKDGKKWTNNTVANSGYRTKTLSVAATAAKNGRMFRCVVTDKYGSSVTTNAAVLYVTK